MAKSTYLDPAYGIICKFAGGGKLSDGIKAIAEVTGADRTRVYRWMRPLEKGGTGGVIPTRHQAKIYEYARLKSIPVHPRDFFTNAA